MAMRNAGFSLIELMIAVAVVAILAAVAYPSYQNSLVKSNRANAQTLMMDIAQREQQYFLDRRSYSSDLSVLKVNVPTQVSAVYTVTVSLSAGPPPGFTVTAVPVSGSRQTQDGTLTLDSTGVKTPPGKW